MLNSDSRIRILFFGTPEFAATGLEYLLNNNELVVIGVVTQPDKPAGRGAKIHESPVKSFAIKNKIPILQPNKIKRELHDFKFQLSKLGEIDIGVVIAFGQILPEEVLSYPRHGCVNLHASILPRWRGAAPIQRAILAGDQESGVCLMKMEAGLDTGAVYSFKKVPISLETTAGELHDQLAVFGGELLSRDIPKICSGKLIASPQSEDGITYAHKISNSDLLINWNQSNEKINRQIRALSPSPGAFSFIQGKRIKIFKARILSQLNPLNKPSPGKISFVDSSRLEVECIGGNLAIEEVQLEGKRRLPIKEFLKGMRLDTTISLGDSQVNL